MNELESSKKSFSHSENLTDVLTYQKISTLSMEERLQFLYPKMESRINELPTIFSAKDKSEFACINLNNPFQVEYLNNYHDPGQPMMRRNEDNGCIRANNPIPVDVGLYYFEIKVLSTGSKGQLYIGLTHSGSDLSRAPGWDSGTYGFHGDDGKKFAAQSWGTNYGPIFRENDVVGCCVNFETQTCFYTVNGKNLGTAFRNIPLTPLYPTVGCGSENEKLEVNFGQTPFIYNIKMEMILNESLLKDRLMQSDLKQTISHNEGLQLKNDDIPIRFRTRRGIITLRSARLLRH